MRKETKTRNHASAVAPCSFLRFFCYNFCFSWLVWVVSQSQGRSVGMGECNRDTTNYCKVPVYQWEHAYCLHISIETIFFGLVKIGLNYFERRFSPSVWLEKGTAYDHDIFIPSVMCSGRDNIILACLAASGPGQLLITEGKMNSQTYK